MLLAAADRLRRSAAPGSRYGSPSHEPTRRESPRSAIARGATMALELARAGEDLKAVVGFHPSLANVRPTTLPTSSARSWSAWARRSVHPPDQPTLPGISYHQRADERAWRAMLDLLHEPSADSPLWIGRASR